MQWGPEPVEIDTSVAFGEILVFVPDNVKVDFRGHANAGELQLFHMSRGGIDVNLHSAERADEGEPLLILDSKASFGAVEVVRTSSPGEVSR